MYLSHLCQTLSHHLPFLPSQMQQTPNFSWVFHLRCVTTSAFLLTIDVALVGYAVYMVYLNGPSIQLLFGFEVRHY